ncbi:MAG TPA: arylesterase [Burkholderiaceae bacterium]|nr:arylesterase [Burkholderiaceae bacterium]
MIFGIRLRRWCLAFLLALGASAFAQTGARPVLLVLGDSLSAEYGLPRDSGWVKLLGDRLATPGPGGAPQYSVVNASISGETTSGGRTRLPALLAQHRPAIVIIELGGNDGLRGLPLAAMRENLNAMVEASQRSGAHVLLVGLRMPPNYGRAYADGFFATFADVARDRKVALAPFLLDGFADQTDLFQDDRIHPSVKAQPLMLDNVWPHLRPLLAARGRH